MTLTKEKTLAATGVAVIIGLIAGYAASTSRSGPVTKMAVAAHRASTALILPLPRASFVRLRPGCVWGSGLKVLQITRHRSQGINIVNTDMIRHRFKQTLGPLIPIPAWYLQHNQAIAVLWKVPGTVTLTTCAGTVKLRIKIS